jgi:hypothetical protein
MQGPVMCKAKEVSLPEGVLKVRGINQIKYRGRQ